MSVDRSLKIKGALRRHRNVLSRAERVEQLKDEERWSEGQSVFGLPKIVHRKSHAGRKAAKEEAAKEVAVTPEAQAEVTPASPTPATPLKEKPKEKPKEKEKRKTTGKT
jgi:small basic protein (TIGR04137 family)